MSTMQNTQLKPVRMDADPIMLVSIDSKHADVRRQILEEAGFEVVPVTNMKSLIEACNKQRFSLAIIGHSISPQEKTRIANAMKTDCYKYIPTLELHAGSHPDIQDVAFSFRQSSESKPDAFLETVRAILSGDGYVESLTGT